MTDNRFTRCFSADRLPLGASVPVTVDGQVYALFHTPKGFFAISNRCPHQGVPLVGCPVLEDSKVRCTMHGWLFQLDPTEAQGGKDGLARPEVRVEDGFVEIRSPVAADSQ